MEGVVTQCQHPRQPAPRGCRGGEGRGLPRRSAAPGAKAQQTQPGLGAGPVRTRERRQAPVSRGCGGRPRSLGSWASSRARRKPPARRCYQGAGPPPTFVRGRLRPRAPGLVGGAEPRACAQRPAGGRAGRGGCGGGGGGTGTAAAESATVTEPWLELASGAGRQQPRQARRLRQGSRGPHNSKKERGERGLGARGLGTRRSPNCADPFWKLILKKKKKEPRTQRGRWGQEGRRDTQRGRQSPTVRGRKEGNSRRQPM